MDVVQDFDYGSLRGGCEMVVTLEPVHLKHAEAIQKLASDPSIGATSNLPSPYPEGGAQAWIQASTRLREQGREYVFAVIVRQRVVGTCGLLEVRKSPYRAELGYWIGRPFWGCGYASSAASLAVDFGFRIRHLERLSSCCLVDNHASRRVLEKTGFRWFRQGSNPHPKWTSSDLFDFFLLTRGDWEASCQG